MKKLFFLTVLLTTVAAYTLFSCKQEKVVPEKEIAQMLIKQIDKLDAICDSLKTVEGTANDVELQKKFLRARLAYKSFEWAAEYFNPGTARFMNGPPVQEVELSGQVFDPAGLQVIESLLYPRFDTANNKELTKQLNRIKSGCSIYKKYFAHVGIFDWQVFDAAKLEVFRVETLGITGFDNPLSLQSMSESARALESLKQLLSFYTPANDPVNLPAKMDAAINYLHAHPGFDDFNRAEFITAYCNPLSTAITAMESLLAIHVIRYNRLLNQDAATLFDKDAYNVNAYSPNQEDFITPEKMALGKILFEDPSLSGDGSRSCQSCHQPGKAFTDGLLKNTVIGSTGLLSRNTPTLLNAALQPSLFYDLRVRTLEDQSRTVVQSNEEMHGSIKLSVERIWQDTAYRAKFSEAFPRKNRNSIDTLEVMNALGSYIRSLVSMNSRFDDYMRGAKNAMNTHEVNGFNIFMGKAKCATCHYMPLFNGNFPPRFVKTDAEVIGVPSSINKKEIDADQGRFNIVKVASLNHAFKTPTLRNASLTAPYMHNGVFNTLEEVMDFYNKGGGRGLGIKVDNQTLPFDKLNLTSQESRDIIAFIKTLESR